MKKNNATIKIISEINGNASDKIELITDGAFYLKNNYFYILYDEKEEMGMAECSVILKASADSVSISRKGSFSSKMIYKTGNATEFIYNTPYGKFPVIIYTSDIKNTLAEIGGKLLISYSITINGEENFHKLSIEVAL